MKKTLSVILVLVMVLAASAATFSASAAAKVPTYAGTENKIITVTNQKAGSNFNVAALIDGSYAGDNLNPMEGATKFGNADACRALGVNGAYYAATNYTAFSEKGDAVKDTAVYNLIMQLTLGADGTAAKTKISSICIAVPAAASVVGNCVPDGFTLYAGNVIWMGSTTNEEAKIAMNKMNYKYVCTVSGLLNDGKYVEADGYRFYEFNLPEPIEATYLLLCFSKEFDLANTINQYNDGKAPNVFNYLTEFCAFEKEIPLADYASNVEHVHVDTTEAPETTAAPETTPVTTAAPITAAPITTAAPVVTTAPDTTPVVGPVTGDSAFVLIAVAVAAVVVSTVIIVRRKEQD